MISVMILISLILEASRRSYRDVQTSVEPVYIEKYLLREHEARA